MTVAELCPSPAEVEANTPATRDRAIDVIRIVSLVAVVVGHTIMATSTLRDDVFIWSNLLTASVVLQALTWVFQIMPLFFFAGVGTYAFIAVIDAIRINVDGMSGLGYLNLVVWLIPGMFGVAYRRRRLADRAALTLGAVMFAVNLALMWLGPYELSLVGIETQHLKNMTPPSLLLAGHAIMMCAFAIAAAPSIARWAQRPRVWWLTAIGNSAAMTLYLWHIPPLLAMHLVFDYFGHPRYDPTAPGFIALSVRQLVIMAILVAAVCVVLRPLENSPLPLWDGGFVAGTGSRSAGWRPPVRGRCGHAGIGRLGPQRSGAVLRRGDAGGAGRGPVPGHRPRVTAQRVCAASRPASTR